MIWWLLACTVDTTDVCPTAKNDSCDELLTCALGTDTTDCDTACRKWVPSDNDFRMAGVCALDDGNVVTKSEQRHGEGTLGEGGLTGSHDATVTVRGSRSSDLVDRQYRVYVPRRYDPETPVPLLFALGGFTVDMYWMSEFTELNRMADREDFIVVYGHPEWRDFGSYDVFSWYVYNNAFEGDWIDNPDIAYMESVYNDLSTQYNIDKSRVYTSGHSRGAALSMIAAFERPDLFAGYWAQAGFGSSNDYNLRIEELLTSEPINGVLIHGDADPDVRVVESDTIHDLYKAAEHEYFEDWLYFRIPEATHEWQSHLNQETWNWLYDHPNSLYATNGGAQ